MPEPDFQVWFERWGLVADGEPFGTGYTQNWLQPVRRAGQAAMLKLCFSEHERVGAALMSCWSGDGAAPVLAHEDHALLMLRANGSSLAAMATSGADEQATTIICDLVGRLHRAPQPPMQLPTLEGRFAAQAERARSFGGVLNHAWDVATDLLAVPQDVRTLHGDVHHGNVLDFGDLGWLAIDPQGVVGERAYDYANLLKNPDRDTALAPGRLARQIDLIAETAGLPPRRLLQWALAHAALSACWSLEDGMDPSFALQVAELAAGLLDP